MHLERDVAFARHLKDVTKALQIKQFVVHGKNFHFCRTSIEERLGNSIVARLPSEKEPLLRDTLCKCRLDVEHGSTLKVVEKGRYSGHGFNQRAFACRLVANHGYFRHFAQNSFRAAFAESIDDLVEKSSIVSVRGFTESTCWLHFLHFTWSFEYKVVRLMVCLNRTGVTGIYISRDSWPTSNLQQSTFPTRGEVVIKQGHRDCWKRIELHYSCRSCRGKCVMLERLAAHSHAGSALIKAGARTSSKSGCDFFNPVSQCFGPTRWRRRCVTLAWQGLRPSL